MILYVFLGLLVWIILKSTYTWLLQSHFHLPLHSDVDELTSFNPFTMSHVKFAFEDLPSIRSSPSYLHRYGMQIQVCLPVPRFLPTARPACDCEEVWSCRPVTVGERNIKTEWGQAHTGRQYPGKRGWEAWLMLNSHRWVDAWASAVTWWWEESLQQEWGKEEMVWEETSA